MLGIKRDTDTLVHLLLGTLAQGEDFYNSQRDEIKNYFGEDIFMDAEEKLKDTRIYKMLVNS